MIIKFSVKLTITDISLLADNVTARNSRFDQIQSDQKHHRGKSRVDDHPLQPVQELAAIGSGRGT